MGELEGCGEEFRVLGREEKGIELEMSRGI